MNLALPAPHVEEAIAPPVEYVEPATAEMAHPSNSMWNIQPPPIVEPATTVTSDVSTEQVVLVPPLSVEGLRMAPGLNHFESEAAILPRAPSKNIIQLILHVYTTIVNLLHTVKQRSIASLKIRYVIFIMIGLIRNPCIKFH